MEPTRSTIRGYVEDIASTEKENIHEKKKSGDHPQTASIHAEKTLSRPRQTSEKTVSRQKIPAKKGGYDAEIETFRPGVDVDINTMVNNVADLVKSAKDIKIKGRISQKRGVRNLSGDLKSFKLKRIVGEGIFGKVWYGKMKRETVMDPNESVSDYPPHIAAKKSSKKIAIKEFDDIYDREVAVIESLIEDNPPGVLRLHGILHNLLTSKPHLVMKFCNKGTAHEFFQSNNFNKPNCYKKMVQMMQVVQAFHEAGYCHRDIHEKNFLLHQKIRQGEELIFLSDFGHAGKLKKEGHNIESMNARPVYTLNSPREIRKLYDEAEALQNFVGYNSYLDKHGVEIDTYQIGMMLFRVAVASKKEPLLPAMDNPHQKKMVTAIDAALKDPSHPFDAYKYLRAEHPKIPKEVARIIAGLITPNAQISLSEAIEKLNNYITDIE